MAFLMAAALLWVVGLAFFRSHRIWVFYFPWGAVGLTLLLILFLRGSPVEYHLERATALLLQQVMGLLSIPASVFDRAAGMVLVFIEAEKSWTALGIDIECSGLLESCVFLGLVFFYPAFSLPKRIFYASTGILAIYLINLLRLCTIVFLINACGRQAIYLAHTLAGRLVFFFLIVALYWAIFSRPTLAALRGHLHD
ncbi:MAG: exosortase family protein XrtG [Bacillota bacterium]